MASSHAGPSVCDVAMKVLVTRGAGFIGSHACKALARAGHTPIVYDDLSTGHAYAVRWGAFEAGDVRDPERLTLVLDRHRPDLSCTSRREHFFLGGPRP
jgi:UDP-glucose 4-epimerase